MLEITELDSNIRCLIVLSTIFVDHIDEISTSHCVPWTR